MSWAQDLDGTGVTVNTLAPGGDVDTAFLLPGVRARAAADDRVFLAPDEAAEAARDPAIFRPPTRKQLLTRTWAAPSVPEETD